MKLFVGCTAMFALMASASQPPRTIHGVVFNDANGNGALDPNERPVSGVVVSNQLDVVTTDAAGRYRLPANETTIVNTHERMTRMPSRLTTLTIHQVCCFRQVCTAYNNTGCLDVGIQI